MPKIFELNKIIRHHAEMSTRLDFSQKVELAGSLLNRDMRKENLEVVELFFKHEGYYLWDLIAVYLFDDTIDNSLELLDELKRILVAYYEPQIETLIKDEEEIIKSEPRENPNDEYDSNLDCMVYIKGT